MKTYSYPYLISWIAKLLEKMQTTGANQSEDLIEFTKLNMKRMARLDKTIELNDKLISIIENLSTPQTWIVITEAWCGDSAQNLPVLYKMAEANVEKITLEIVLRDDNLEFMQQYQTNGSNSIPKLICRNEQGEDLFTWGPRPQEAQDILNAWKANPGDKTWEQFELELHTWYAQNKTVALQDEFQILLEKV